MSAPKSYPVDYTQIRRLVSLTMVLSRYGLIETLTRSGQQLRGPCPIHSGTNKRQFVVNPRDGTWHCFGNCSRGGAMLELVAELEKVDVHEAAVRIAQWFAVSSPHLATTERRSKMSAVSPSFKVFTVSDREWKDPKTGEIKKGWWTRIGTAFENKDGSHNVQLDALPVPTIYDGAVQTRIVLRPYEDEEQDPEPPKKAARK
ncbi:DNA primase [Hyphomicrobium denitrificans 1NES1]|uniref:DNA primase n=1 Tax=Hyphomicrobium denitrificans 1NES1 TaxID=670307 RepID=N0B936_9HYPH|nr:CHC2 zinc finger domain-containing protein [Hyphomicrobium denitrificans]AGK57026.1 DNA primase [Hyphomicrobium denitrificans 1NES1]